MKNPSRRTVLNGFVGRLKTVLIVIFTCLLLVGCSNIATADELVANYQQNRTAFAELVRLAPADTGFSIEATGDAGSPGVPAEYEEFAQPFSAIGATRIHSTERGIEVELGMEGFVVSGASWGYRYSPTEPPTDIVSIDTARGAAPDLWYYPVGDEWYAFVYRW